MNFPATTGQGEKDSHDAVFRKGNHSPDKGPLEAMQITGKHVSHALVLVFMFHVSFLIWCALTHLSHLHVDVRYRYLLMTVLFDQLGLCHSSTHQTAKIRTASCARRFIRRAGLANEGRGESKLALEEILSLEFACCFFSRTLHREKGRDESVTAREEERRQKVLPERGRGGQADHSAAC